MKLDRIEIMVLRELNALYLRNEVGSIGDIGKLCNMDYGSVCVALGTLHRKGLVESDGSYYWSVIRKDTLCYRVYRELAGSSKTLTELGERLGGCVGNDQIAYCLIILVETGLIRSFYCNSVFTNRYYRIRRAV